MYVGFKIIFENTHSRKIKMVSAKPFMIQKKKKKEKPKGSQCWTLLRGCFWSCLVQCYKALKINCSSQKKILFFRVQESLRGVITLSLQLVPANFNSKIQAATHYRREPKLNIWL